MSGNPGESYDAIQELRQVPGTVQGESERFLAASVIIAAAIARQVSHAGLIALKREAKTLKLMTFGEFDDVAKEARKEGADGDDGPGSHARRRRPGW